MSTRTLDDLADEISLLREQIEAITIPSFHQVSVVAGDPDAGTITLGIDGEELPDVTVPSTYIPEAGHTVPIIMNGLDAVVLAPQGAPTSAAPDAPATPTAVGTVAGLLVEWDANTDANVRWNKGYYELQWDTDNTFASPSSLDTAATAAVLQDLTVGVEIFVRVRAVNYAGTASAWSSTGSGTPIEVDADLIAAGSITATEIDDNAITTPKLAAGAVVASKITAGTITSTQIATGTIVAGNIAAATITGTQIAASTITGAKIAAGTVTAANITALTITASELAASAVTTAKLDANAVTAQKLSAVNIEAGKYIRSTTFVAGSTGWSIDADGTAEFGTVTVRGIVSGATIVQSPGPNLNPNPSAATNTTGWTAVTNCAVSRVTSKSYLNGYIAGSDTTGLRATSTASGSMTVDSANIAVIPGRGYGVEGVEQSLLGTSTGFSISLRWYQSDGTTLVSTSTAQTSDFEGGSSEWILIYPGRTAPLIAPTNAAFARIRLTIPGATAGSQTADFAGLKLATVGSLDGETLDVGTYGLSGDRLLKVHGAQGFGSLVANTRTVQLGDNQSVATIWLQGHVTTDNGVSWATKHTALSPSATKWTALTTNPTGRSVSATYLRVGQHIRIWVALDFPGAMTAGSGQYVYDLSDFPINTTVHGASAAIGTWTCSLGGSVYSGVIRRSTSTACRLNLSSGAGAVSATAPAVPVSGDTYWLALDYITTA